MTTPRHIIHVSYNDDRRAYSQPTCVTFVEVMSEADAHGDLAEGHCMHSSTHAWMMVTFDDVMSG